MTRLVGLLSCPSGASLHRPRSEPWPTSLGPQPDFYVENTETGETYWPNSYDLMIAELVELRRNATPDETVAARLQRAHQLIGDAMKALT